MSHRAFGDSLALSMDLFVTRSLIWLATVGREAELTTETHNYLYD